MYLQLEVLLGSVCGIVALFPILLPFSFGVPAPTAEHCWIAEPFRSEDGFFGYPLESNDNFVLLFVLYVLANAVSSLGVFMSGRICVKLARAGDYRAGRYRQYLRSLLAYFLAQLIVTSPSRCPSWTIAAATTTSTIAGRVRFMVAVLPG